MPRTAGKGLVIVTGIKEIDRALKQLEPKLQKKVVRQAARKALKPIMAEIKANAPFRTGLLKASIKVRAAKRSRKGIRIMILMGEGDFKGETFYGAFQEYGTSRMPGKHFMRTAYQHHKDSAKAQIQADILRGVETIVRHG